MDIIGWQDGLLLLGHGFVTQPAMGGSTKAYTRTLVSFQLTGATNICGVNNLPSVTNYVSKKVRGKGKTKRNWGIEQNEARET
jgi:hypothetical protein